MKKELIFAFSAFFFMSLSAITGVYAVEEANKTEIISKDLVDLTGDDKKETIYIKGIPVEDKAEFLKEIYISIVASNGKEYKINLDGGYEPSIQYKDLNNDGINDMFISVPTGGSGGLSNFYLYTLKDYTLTDLTVPEPLIIQSEFLNDYKGKITITEINKSYTFDLKDRAKDYERLGLYINGSLSEPSELMVLPYGTLTPVRVQNQRLGLEGVQRISGAYNADSIAFVESKWIMENGKWELLETKVKKIDSPKKEKED
ncbi:hypothetical protein ACFYKX_01690 [Cytobacillus sp. FJAT-54145]|uniref:VCBS repeat-containing protein n=1 Tax=Cytobacillus spartinae TaxID=3299023 RepID=A0ABW6K589_9BACI